MAIAWCETISNEISNLLEKNGYEICTFQNKVGNYQDVEIILGNPPKEQLIQCINLKFMQLRSAGANGYDDPHLYASMNHPLVCTAQEVFNIPMAEWVVGMIMVLGKKSLSRYLCSRIGMGG